MIKKFAKGQDGFPEATIVYYPDNAPSFKGLPIFIYLHGKGEYGDGSEASLQVYQTNAGHLPNWLSQEKGLKIGSAYYKPPFAVFSPLMPKGVVLERDRQIKYVKFIKEFSGTNIVAIGGSSFGGKGTVLAREEYEKEFVCFLPMAAAYEAKENMRPSTAPMWSHHGAEDTIVHPNWSVWNSEYSIGNKSSLENKLKEMGVIKSLSDLSKITSDINMEWNPIFPGWDEMHYSTPITDACTIYAGKNHGIQYHVLHQKRVWDFLEFHLFKGIDQPPVEEPVDERPLKDIPDGILALLTACDIEGKIIPQSYYEVMKESSIRVDEAIKKYNL